MNCDCETTVHHKLNRESVQLQIVSVFGRIWGGPANEASRLLLVAPVFEYVQAAEEAVIAGHACLRPSHCDPPLQGPVAMIFIFLLPMGAALTSPIGSCSFRRGSPVMPGMRLFRWAFWPVRRHLFVC